MSLFGMFREFWLKLNIHSVPNADLRPIFPPVRSLGEKNTCLNNLKLNILNTMKASKCNYWLMLSYHKSLIRQG
jgi:hypothetical protein